MLFCKIDVEIEKYMKNNEINNNKEISIKRKFKYTYTH